MTVEDRIVELTDAINRADARSERIEQALITSTQSTVQYMKIMEAYIDQMKETYGLIIQIERGRTRWPWQRRRIPDRTAAAVRESGKDPA